MFHRKKKGFTIIEVVLVLAIAGLIFLMVFVALPALQRSQRNAQRKRDVDRVYTAIIEYQKNNHNSPPCKNSGFRYGCDFDTRFIPHYVDSECEFDDAAQVYFYTNCGKEFTDPDGTIYNVYVTDVVYYGQTKPQNSDQKAVSLDSILKTFGAIGYEDMNAPLQHSIYLAFGFSCAETEGKIFPTTNPYDFAVAKELEGGGWYCHASYTGENTLGELYEYNIKPDLNVAMRR